MEKSYSESYKAAGVDITAGYKAVELMKAHIAKTRNEGCLDDVGGFGGCFGHALEKEMATHSSVLAWRIPGTGEPIGLPSMGSHRVGHD